LDESFDSALMDALTDDGTTSTESPEAPQADQETTTETPELDTSYEPQDEDDLRSFLEQAKAANPEQAAVIDRLHREMQGAFTPKLQQAAELRKAYEGVDPQLAAWARQMNELATSSPQEAAAALMAEAERLRGLQQAAPEIEEPDFATDYDAEVWREVQELKQLKQQILAERNEAVFNAELDRQAKDLGIEIPYEERHRVLLAMHQDRAPANAAKRYWRDLYFDRAIQKARDDAAGVVTKKAGMSPPPTAIANRAGQGEAPAPASLEDAIRAEFRARQIA
jgi:hypothetical protein